MLKTIISEAREILAKKHNISIRDLHYIGYTDCSCIKGEGAVSVLFNITKKCHPSYKSTVAVNSWNM
jgi:hypothetical protein